MVDWKLTAIRISGADKTAIVNNRLVRVGEMIGSANVIDIEAEGVKLDYNNKQLLIRLYSETNIKKPVNNNNTN